MPSSPRKPEAEAPILEFKTPDAWARWLDRNHVASSGIWMRLAKKAASERSVTYPDALDIAIAYGWIDGQRRGESDTTWRIKFTPRSKKSIWSRINRAKALSLTEQGRMKPAGLAEIEKAKKDGRWEAAYDGQRVAAVPSDLKAALNKNPRARAFFATLDSRNRYAILFRLHTARKEETRAKRLALFVAMLEKHEKLHP